MEKTTLGSDSAANSGSASAPLEIDIHPVIAPEASDPMMLAMQYGLAVVAAICAILLSRAS